MFKEHQVKVQIFGIPKMFTTIRERGYKWCWSYYNNKGKGKGKTIPLQAWTGPEGSRRLRLPRFEDNRHMMVARLSVLGTGRLYPPGNISGTNFC